MELDVMCRACLQTLVTHVRKHEIFAQQDLAKKLTVCTALSVEPDDGYPKYLCDCCHDKLLDFHQFHTMCIESAQRFREMQELSLDGELPFEDEKPEFDLNAQSKMHITIVEPEVLLPNEVTSDDAEETTMEMRQRRIRSVKTKAAEAIKEELEELQSAVTCDILAEQESHEDNTDDDDDEDNDDEFDVHQDDSEDEFPLAMLQRKCHKKSKNNTGNVTPTGMRKKRKKCRRSNGDQMSTKSTTIFQCDICPTRFFVEHRLVAHKRKHDGLVPYPCPRDDCERAFNRWHCLSEHLKQHEGTSRSFICEEDGCGRVYKHKPTLVMHLRKYHKHGPELKSHVCEICGKVFKTTAILNDHRYTHKDKSELPYACEQPQCVRRFSNREKLKVHLMRHAGIKNFVCPHCGMRKTTRNELKIHINYHTLERTWPCRFCTHVCNNAGNLKTHIRTVHERAKDYACSYCERTFAKPDTRKYHEMTHTGEKPHECEECGKRFTQPAALRTHRKIHQRHSMQTTPTTTLLSGVNNVADTLPNVNTISLHTTQNI